MTEDVDFDPEAYVAKLEDQLTRSDEEYRKLRDDLKGERFERRKLGSLRVLCLLVQIAVGRCLSFILFV